MSAWRAGSVGPDRTITILWAVDALPVPCLDSDFPALVPGRVCGCCLDELGRSEAKVLARINLLANWFLCLPLDGESPMGLSVYEM